MSNGCRCGTISVPILGDTMTEGTETFTVNLSSPTNATIGDAQAIGTIYDNEGPPALIVLDGSADESAGSISFDLIMTSSSVNTKTVDYATVDATATAGSDYTSTAGTKTIPSGQTTATIVVPIANDTVNEADETFSLLLSNSTVAVSDGSGIGSIFDDDPEPAISIADTSAAEAAGTLSFTISLSTASGQEVDVDYATTDGTALAGTDFAAGSGTAVIAAGATSTQVDITLTDDTTYEGDEGLTLNLTAPFNASIADAQAVGTVQDDDPLPAASIDDVQVAEGNAGTTAAAFTVSLANASAFGASVDWATADATATGGTDFTATGGTVSFSPGETTAQVAVDVSGDITAELNETFAVTFANPSGATVADATGVGTITDDDRSPTSFTLKVTKTRTKVGAKGVFETATSGATVSVSLYRRKGAKWVKLSTRAVAVSKLGDRDADGRADGLYRAAFPRPAKGTYQLRASFAGSPTLLPSRKSATFKR